MSLAACSVVVSRELLQEFDEREVEVVELLAVVRVRLLQPLEVVLAQPLDFDRAADLTLAAVDADGGEDDRVEEDEGANDTERRQAVDDCLQQCAQPLGRTDEADEPHDPHDPAREHGDREHETLKEHGAQE